MRLRIGDARLPAYLQQIAAAEPARLDLQGVGRQVGKACWLALVLETEYGFQRRGISLRRTMLDGTRDLATIEIELEGKHGTTGERQG